MGFRVLRQASSFADASASVDTTADKSKDKQCKLRSVFQKVSVKRWAWPTLPGFASRSHFDDAPLDCQAVSQLLFENGSVFFSICYNVHTQMKGFTYGISIWRSQTKNTFSAKH